MIAYRATLDVPRELVWFVARLLLAEEFAQQLQAIVQAGSTDANPVSDQPLSEQEVNEWLSIFRKRGNQK